MACVKAHPHPENSTRWPCLGVKQSLRIGSRRDSLRGALKNRKEAVAMAINFHATVSKRRLPNQVKLTDKGRFICFAEKIEKSRRSLDVSKENCQRSGQAGAVTSPC